MQIEITSARFDELEPWLDAARREGAHLDRRLKSRWLLLKATLPAGTILGWVGLLHRTSRYATIRGWYTRPNYRGFGIGTALLDAAIDLALKIGVQQIDIRTRVTAPLERAGFDWTGYQRKHGNREEHWILPLPCDQQESPP